MSKARYFAKTTALLMAVMLILSGCRGSVITDPDYESVVYRLDAGGADGSEPSSEESRADRETSSSSSGGKYVSSAASGTAAAEERTDTDKDGDKTKEIQKNVLIFSAMDSKITASKLMPTLAYVDGNKVMDTLFNCITVMPGQNFVYDTSNGGTLRPLTQNDWSSYINNYVFKSGCNLEAAEQATGVIKNLLELPDYKVGVYLSILYPVKSVTDWGTYNGKKLDFSSGNADRISGVKWMIDEQIRLFKEKNYKNIELLGFYYYKESCSDEDLGFLPAVTDYVRSRGYVTTWIPYFRAPGAMRWKEFGFDIATMQANYFPGSPNLPNNGGIERILQAATLAKQVGLNVEMELSGTDKTAITGLKEYMRGGIKYGFMNQYHAWWLGSGPMTVKTLAESGDVYTRSAYSEMYKFIKGTLQEADILIN